MISAYDLIAFNQRGFIPGPNESEEDFLKRVDFLKELAEDAKKFFSEEAPFPLEERVKRQHWDLKRGDLKRLFDVSPDWLAAFYHNQKLPFWQGAVTWIFHDPVRNVKLALLQLRKGLRKGRHLGIYQLDEIMAHEAAHAARMAFESSIFEEHFAYLTSSSTIRRVFGPIVRNAWEVPLLLIFLTGMILGMAFDLLGDLSLGKLLFKVFYGCSLLWASLGLIRLIKLHIRFVLAYRKISKLVKDKAFAVLFRLTDREIRLFSKSSVEEIQDYILKEKDKSLRWRLIYAAYFAAKSL